jgi:MFS transporter, DHA2 family, multidrug resistance protein
VAANGAGAGRAENAWLITVAVMAGTFMVVLDTTVVNVSLPHIAGSLSATIDESTWALTSYLAANAVVLPITGWLANFFGRRRLLLAAVTTFTAASFLCGLAPSLPVLIFFRIVQGATGGVMQPLSQSIMLEAFPPHERGQAMAVWGMGIVAAPIFGPVLGGWLTDSYSWRWIFYINIPVGVLSVVLMRAFIHDPPYIRRGSARVDGWGIGLLAVGVGALQIALDKGQEDDWFSSRLITVLLVVAAVGLVAFVARELIIRDPVVDLRVFRLRTYAAGVLLISLMGFVMYGALVMGPELFQTLLGYSPLRAGLVMSPRGIGTVLVMPLVGVLIARTDPRGLLAAGLLIGAGSLFWFSHLDLEAGFANIVWMQLLQGIGFGLLFVPLTTVTMDPIPKERMGNATSLFNLLRNIGGGFGIATVETILARAQQVHTNVLGAHVDAYSPQSRAMLGGLAGRMAAAGADATTAANRALGEVFGLVERHAKMLSFVDTYRFLGLIFLVITPLVLLMKRPAASPRPGAAVSE